MSETKATRAAYGEALVKLGHENDKIVVLDADLSNATMTMNFAREFPNRHFDVGIAEANMVDMAAGMSTMGLIPFCSTFAVFAGRSYDQIRNGVCYPHFNVKLAFTHAGLSVGEDGGSHQAIEDIALMRVLPGMTVICPCDANETYQAVKAAAEIKGPVYLRLARLATPVMDPMPFTVGKGTVLVDGQVVDETQFGLENGITGEPFSSFQLLEFPQTVPEGCVFGLGDNRAVSEDSRYQDVGMIDKRNILGKAVLHLFPFQNFGLV